MNAIKSFCVALLVSATSASLAAQTHEVHLGGGLPVYSVLGVAFPDGAESISPGLNLGYKCFMPINRSLEWYLGADVYERSIRFEELRYIGLDRTAEMTGRLVNIPLGAGLRCSFPVARKLSLYIDAGAGLNIDIGHKSESDGHGMDYNVSNGQPLRQYESMSYAKGLTVENSFTGVLGFLKDGPSAFSTYFSFQLGASFARHWSLGLSYANFGVAEVCRYQSIVCSDRWLGGPGGEGAYLTGYNGGKATIVLSSLSLEIAYEF